MRWIRYTKSAFSERKMTAGAALPKPVRKGMTWVDIDAAERGSLQSAARAFKIHPLALEDALHLHQRPKFEDHGSCYFFVLPLLSYRKGLKSAQISLFFGDSFVVSAASTPVPGFELVAERLRHDRAGLRGKRADALLHSLVDSVIDTYAVVLEKFDERFGELEAIIASRQPQRAATGLRGLRLDLFHGHRLLLSLEEALTRLHADREDFIEPNMQPYFRDLIDHVARALDHVDSLREAAADLMQLQHAALTERTGEATQVLTVIATIFMPLSFIAGVYGMNFDRAASAWNMPELGWAYGYLAVLALMLSVALGMLFFFRRRGWLGQGLFWRKGKPKRLV